MIVSSSTLSFIKYKIKRIVADKVDKTIKGSKHGRQRVKKQNNMKNFDEYNPENIEITFILFRRYYFYV